MTTSIAWPRSDSAPHVKVCGITRVEDAHDALRAGATFLGLIFAESPRRVEPAQARQLVASVHREYPGADFVGVFVNTPLPEIRDVVERVGLFAAQLHGDMPMENYADNGIRILKAFSVASPSDDSAIARAQTVGPVLLDAFSPGMHGGTGKIFDHQLALPAIRRGPVFIAGGLNPTNIFDVVRRLSDEHALPYALDVSSGLEEKPGRKSPERIRAFFEEIRRALQP